MPSKLDAALDAVKRGFRVFPVRPEEKKPAVDGWQMQATDDPDVIKRWWTQNPRYNIGIPADGLLVVDLDVKHNGPQHWKDMLDLLAYADETAPPTRTSLTQSGGLHLIYRLPEGVRVKNSASALGPGIDVKTDGGYIVGPGSTINGKQYKWVEGETVPTRPALAPDWLIAKCKQTRTRSKNAAVRLVDETPGAVALAQKWLETHAHETEEGGRSDECFKVAAKLYDFGLEFDTVAEMMQEWNATYCYPPLDPEEVERMAENGGKHRAKPIGGQSPDYNEGFEAVEIDESMAPSARMLEPSAETKRRGLFFINEQDGAKLAYTTAVHPLIEGLLDTGAMSIIYGESNSGKSFVAMDMGYHIAAGLSWGGRKTARGAVVWVAAEGGRGVYKRLAAWRMKHKISGKVPFYVVPCPVDLRSPAGQAKQLVDLIKQIGEIEGQPVQLVIIDTLNRVMAGGDENSAVDMGQLVHHFDLMRDALKAHLMVVHHSGKDKFRGARGHSSLRAATDTELEVDNHTIVATKQRDMESNTRIRFKLHPAPLGPDNLGNDMTSCWVDVEPLGAPWASELKRRPLTELQRENIEKLSAWLREKRAAKTAVGQMFSPADAYDAILPEELRDDNDAQRGVRQMIKEWSKKGAVKGEENPYVMLWDHNQGAQDKQDNSLS